MTIKQQGGVFGRNPTFNDVEVDGTLTVGGNAVPDASTLLVDGDIGSTVQAYDADTAKLDVAQSFTANQTFSSADIQNTVNPTFSIENTNTTLVQDQIVGQVDFYANDASGAGAGQKGFIKVISSNSSGSLFDMLFGVGDNTQQARELVRLTYDGNLKFTNAGNGIDFSATAGTGTSELLSDYEHGTWVPTLTTDGTDFDSVTYDSVTYGWYTKVGNVVAVGGRLRTDAVTVGAGSGNLVIGGLPFSVVKTGAISIGRATSFVTKYPKRAEVSQGTSYIALFGLTAVNTGTTNLDETNVGTGTNANYISFSGVYQV